MESESNRIICNRFAELGALSGVTLRRIEIESLLKFEPFRRALINSLEYLESKQIKIDLHEQLHSSPECLKEDIEIASQSLLEETDRQRLYSSLTLEIRNLYSAGSELLRHISSYDELDSVGRLAALVHGSRIPEANYPDPRSEAAAASATSQEMAGIEKMTEEYIDIIRYIGSAFNTVEQSKAHVKSALESRYPSESKYNAELNADVCEGVLNSLIIELNNAEIEVLKDLIEKAEVTF
jgi:hypothetical protein